MSFTTQGASDVLSMALQGVDPTWRSAPNAWLTGGLSGVVYKLRCKATDSAGGVHVIVGRLQVQRL